MSTRLAAAAATLLLAMSGIARADAGAALLEDARVALDDIDFETARGLIARAIAAGDLDATELALAYRMGGEVAAALGDAPAARDQFVRWILLDPEASLGAGESPKIAEPFADAQAKVEQLGAFTVEVDADRQPAKLHLSIQAHDPLAMIEGIRVRLGDGAVIAHTGLALDLPADDDTAYDVTVIVHDEHGNALAEREVTSAPAYAVVASPTVRRDRFPAPVRWPTWAVLTAIAGGAGGYFAYAVRNDRDELDAINAEPELHTFDDATAVAARGDRHALYANVAFGVAAAAAITTILTFVLEPGPVEILPAPGGAAAAVRF